MKLWDKLSALIADEKVAESAQRQVQLPQPEHGGAGTAHGAGLAGPALTPAAANAVLSMLPKGQSLDQFSAGQIQLLNIESVRADLGDRWSKVEHQVHLLVEATLRRMLTESDIFTQVSDYEYLVIFPNLTEQKASALMYVAAAQIRQKLFGYDPAFAAIHLNATVTRVGRDAMDTPPDAVAAIHEAALLGEPAQPEPETPPEQPLTPAIRPWTDKYKIVPIEGGHMSQARIVADSMSASGPALDLSGLAERSQATSSVGSGQTPSAAGRDPSEPAPVAGYPVVPITGAGQSDPQLVQEPTRPRHRLPDFSAVKETYLHRSAGGAPRRSSGGPAPQAETEIAVQDQGYPVVPIKVVGRREGHLVQDAPRAHGRVPDFSSAHAAPDAADPQSRPTASGGVTVPALAARLDSLAAEPAPLKAIPITRPMESKATGWGCLDSMAGAVSDAGAQITPVEIEDLQLLYEPIWDVRRQAVTAYRMKITLKVEGAPLGLTEFCATYDDPKLQATLNSVILRKLVSQLQMMRREQKRAIVVAPIGRRFVEEESGLRFVLDQLNLLSAQERQLVVLEIGDAYFGSWPALTPRIAVIHRLCRNVGIRLSLDHKDFQLVAATGANTAAGDLSDHDWPERQTLGALNSFAAGAARASLRSAIGGLDTSSMVIAAVCAGVGHLSGSVIGEGTAVPLGVYPLSTEGFYLQRQAQRMQQGQEN